MGQALSLNCGSGTRQVFNAATAGETQTLQEALIARPELLEATASGGQNVVHLSAARGDKDILKAIVDAFKQQPSVVTDGGPAHDLKLQTMRDVHGTRALRAAFNLRTNAGQTPLMLAARNGHVQCVKFLLDNGADVFKIDKSHQRSVLHYAVSAGQDRVLRYLVSESTIMHSEEGVQPLRSIQVKDISGQCRYIDSRAENGLTALHIAAARGDLKCVKLLLEAGASMMVRTVDMDMPSQHSVPNGSTPLHLAAQKGNVSIVQVMLQAHADALGTWHGGSEGSNGRRGWEQSTRIDLRSVANAMRQLPYHVAWQRGYRQTAQILNPTIAIDIALENVRELEEGFGPQKLSTLAAYCLRKNLLSWLEGHREYVHQMEEERKQRATAKKVITQQKRKEALQFHSQESVDDSIQAANARLVSIQDQGHTFSLNSDRQSPGKRSSKKERKREAAAIMDTIQSVNMNPSHGGASSQSLGDELPDVASEFQSEAAQTIPAADMDDSSSAQTSSAHADQSSKHSANMKRFASASRKLKNSMKKLRPTRPPPPPPPEGGSSSHDSSTIALPQHRRTLSWERGPPVRPPEEEEEDKEDGTPRAVANCFVSPFRSPFAQASGNLPTEEPEETELPAPPMTSHPSGVCLVDPPDALPLSLNRHSSTAAPTRTPRLTASKSRKSSITKDNSLVLSSFTTSKSKKGRTLSRAFSRAASIPGFDNNLDADDDCGICLEETVNVAISECSHKLCVDCAIKLCQTAKKPPLCPFCRITINAFQTA